MVASRPKLRRISAKITSSPALASGIWRWPE
jgi:hypothetical protein